MGPMTRFILSRATQELREIDAPKSLYLGVTTPSSHLTNSAFIADLGDVGSLDFSPLILKIDAASVRKFGKRLIPMMAAAREKGVRFALSGVRSTDFGLQLPKDISFEMAKIGREVLALDADKRSIQFDVRPAAQFENMIADGAFEPGMRLPSVRKASSTYRGSTLTIPHACHTLERRGLIVARPRSGYFVTRRRALTGSVRIASRRHVVDAEGDSPVVRFTQAQRRCARPGLAASEPSAQLFPFSVLPGMGALSTITILLPLTYSMAPVSAILMLGGTFCGPRYGGVIGAIMLNLPCHPPHAVTCLDGYPLAKHGAAAPHSASR
jgi:hypothetical protein